MTKGVIKNLLSTIENFDIDFDEDLKTQLEKLLNLEPKTNKPIIFENITNAILEDYKAESNTLDISKLTSFLGENLAIFEDSDFKNLDLPVLARNALENGVSQNLWYEEIVPKQTTFFFCIAKPTNINPSDYEQKIKGFENRFTKEGSKIQIGANKSIGYGFCKITKESK